MKCDDEFVNSNIGLVKSIAKRFCGRGTEFEDLVQIGCIGLIKAGEKFDENFRGSCSIGGIFMRH